MTNEEARSKLALELAIQAGFSKGNPGQGNMDRDLISAAKAIEKYLKGEE